MTTPTQQVSYRNQLHFSVRNGWINDPNGFSFYSGEYHLFFQYNPSGSTWGTMHWGHAVSKDLIRWTPLPIALSPGADYDRDGCYSGTAVEEGTVHLLMYTGHRNPSPDNPGTVREVQCLATGDGRRYQKLKSNPVIGTGLVPEGSSASDFRDPKIWKEDEYWYCLVASRDSGGGKLLLYRAERIDRWEFVGRTVASGNALGSVWECPDLFGIGSQEVLMWSAQGIAEQSCRFQNECSTLYSIGSLNRHTGEFRGAPVEELDFGPDFYAPQTLRVPDGRRILIAWMQTWQRTIPTDELGHGWAGSMTIPREIELEGGALIQRPVRELMGYRRDHRRIVERIVGERDFPQVRGHLLDLKVGFTVLGARRFGLIVKRGEAERTVISYSVVDEILTFDRSRSGFPIRSTAVGRPECSVYCVQVKMTGNRLDLRIILDRSSCEIFADGGRRVLSATLYPAKESDGVASFASGGEVDLDCEVWDLQIPELPT